MQPSTLDGQVGIITGAGRGIGEVYARSLAEAGCHIAVFDINGSLAEKVAHDIGNGAMAFAVDVSDEAAMLAAAKTVHEKHGRIDILVNNAAMFADDIAGFAPLDWDLIDGDMDQWRRMHAVNVEGIVIGVRAVVPFMRDRGYGRIVNQTSVGAYVDSGIYALTKLEVSSLTRTLARKLASQGITVNAIGPGLIATDAVTRRPGRTAEEVQAYLDQTAHLSPAGRVGRPEDLLSTLHYLVSPASEYVNGQIVLVDGGWIRRI